MSLKERLELVQSRIDKAARQSGRSLKDISVVAVTKGVDADRVAEAVQAGVLIFGENKVQEAEAKIPAIQPSPEWHMIGHLQSNKVKQAVSLFQMIQSVDSVRVAREISLASLAANKQMPVLLEVNISGEAKKFGFKPEEIYTAIEEIIKLSSIKVTGLMGIGPLGVPAAGVRESFRKLRKIFSVCQALKRENLQMQYLSMGMSDDFETAVEEGSNMLRLGRVLFGERK